MQSGTDNALFPPAPVHSRPLATEAEAARKVTPSTPSIRVEVLVMIREAGEHGRTTAELIEAHAAAHDYEVYGNSGTIGTRVTELRRGGFVRAAEADGKPVTRQNRRGNECQVWVATDKEGDGRKVEKLFP